MNEVIYCPCAKMRTRLRFWHDIVIKGCSLGALRSLLVMVHTPFVINYSRTSIDWKLIGEILRFAAKENVKLGWDAWNKERSFETQHVSGKQLMERHRRSRQGLVPMTESECELFRQKGGFAGLIPSVRGTRFGKVSWGKSRMGSLRCNKPLGE